MTDGIDDGHKSKPTLRLVTGKRSESGDIAQGKVQGNVAPGASGRAASGLTHKQERFAQALADGETLVGAYRLAYDTSAMQQKTVENEASKLGQHHGVAQRVQDILAAKQAKSDRVQARTEDRIWRGVWELAEGADIAPATKATALALAARMAGLFNDKIEVKQAGSAADIERELMERLQRYAK
jgi:hypothetical protein